MSALSLGEDSTPNPTIRPPQSKVPPALRMLFQDHEATSDPFKIPGFDSPTPAALNSSLLPLPLLGPPKGRGRSRSATSSQPSDQEDEVLTAKQPTFEFPPRMSTPRTPSRQGLSSASESDDPPKRERPPPLGAGIPRSTGPGLSSGPAKGDPSFRDMRSERDIPDFGTLPLLEEDIVKNATASDTSLPLVFSSSSPERSSARPSRPLVSRQRSQNGTAESGGAPYQTLPEWNFPTTKEFQFPPPGFSSNSSLPAPPSHPKTHSRVSPTHSSASTISSNANSSRSSHQFTQSLDASVLPRRAPSPPGPRPTPPNINRSRSATPFGENQSPNGSFFLKTTPKKPSMTRLASVAVMETVQTPSRPWSRNKEARSGSLGDVGPPLPGLKDVLKVCLCLMHV